MLGGAGLRRRGLEAASRIAEATSARLLSETFPARLERGAGIPAVNRLAYVAEFAAGQMEGARHLILAGARPPVTFFAYPTLASSMVPAGCDVHLLAAASDDGAGALAALVHLVRPDAHPALPPPSRRVGGAVALARLGRGPAGPAGAALPLSRPALDFPALAPGMGGPPTRAVPAAEVAAQRRTALAGPGPHLIEAVVPVPW